VLALRLRVFAERDQLDTALALGVNPHNRPELALRAAQLEGRRHRRALARTMRRIVRDACGRPVPSRAAAVPMQRGQIRAGASDLLAAAERIASGEPADPSGIAIAQWLITNVFESPLYVESDDEAVSRLSRRAIARMDRALVSRAAVPAIVPAARVAVPA
jgi:hypothetical protein